MILRFILLVLLVLLSGCAGSKLPLPPAPAAEVLLHKLFENSVRWQQLDAAAEVGMDKNGHYLSTNQYLLLEKPDRLRVDVLTFFGQLALQLSVDQDEMQIFLNTTIPGQYYKGPASDELLARLTRLPLRASELIRLLLYDPPQSSYQNARIEVKEDRYLLRLLTDGGEQQFAFDALLQLRRCVYARSGAPLLIVEYNDVKEDGFPRRVRIQIPRQQTIVNIRFSELKFNQPTKTGRFVIKRPANAVPLQLPGLDDGKERS